MRKRQTEKGILQTWYGNDKIKYDCGKILLVKGIEP